MIDKFVDLSLARYLEKAHGIAHESDEDLERSRESADLRELLKDWSTSQEEKKKRRNCVPMNLTTPQPGSVVVDKQPLDKVILIEAPMMDESLQMNLSDRAYQESGDIVGVGIDTSREKVYKGEEAVKMIDELMHPSSTTAAAATAAPTSVKENYTYDRLVSIVDDVDQR